VTPLDGCQAAEYACLIANGGSPEHALAAARAMPHIPEALDTPAMRMAIQCGLLDASRLVTS
jgi:hypothetical protein